MNVWLPLMKNNAVSFLFKGYLRYCFICLVKTGAFFVEKLGVLSIESMSIVGCIAGFGGQNTDHLM